ncbi:ATP-binding protein [Inquilinus limosus]|uniref:ATP-binding protein n=1 Tax=Inquilinus limosus TaxID=171674 RepID=UPI003F161A49
MSTVPLRAAAKPVAAALQVDRRDVWLGKDVLELLSTAMYVDPLVVYREYIQNAADSVDAARRDGLLNADSPGSVSIRIDAQARSVRIRDDGKAIEPGRFLERMIALGGSKKRGTAARGFRGVGRLAGLGHAQELVFRSRAEGQPDVSEIRWDCRKLKAFLSDLTFDGNVADLVAQVVNASTRPTTKEDGPRFFEVELLRVARGRSDKLLSPEDVSDYLAQIAPVPFHPEFTFGPLITRRLSAHPGFCELEIRINEAEPITRPHRNTVDLGGRVSTFEAPTFTEIPSLDGENLAAIAWFLHHGYEGALTVGTLVKGVRLRVGNLQVGDSAILEGIFPELRFNSWAVGEVHVLDPRLIPNGRRDQFEPNVHYTNLLNHLGPLTRDIATRCRTYSSRRSKLREFELTAADVRGRADVLSQGGLDESGRSGVMAAAETALLKLEKIAAMPLLAEAAPGLVEQIAGLKRDLIHATETKTAGDPLEHLPEAERAFFQRMIKIIYAHSTNKNAAKALVDRILEQEIAGQRLPI